MQVSSTLEKLKFLMLRMARQNHRVDGTLRVKDRGATIKFENIEQ